MYKDLLEALEASIGLEDTMREVMFDIPSEQDVAKCVIDENCIRNGKQPTIIFKQKKQSGSSINTVTGQSMNAG